MSSVLLIAEPGTLRSAMAAALQQAGETVEAIEPQSPALASKTTAADWVLPLTFDLPPDWNFPGRSVWATCQQIDPLRTWVQNTAGVLSGEASFWLPIVLTAKGVLYGEAITIQADSYQQPLHLTDQQRQPLYQLAWQLLQHLQAPPSLYLLGGSYQDGELLFDRLLPFPNEAALSGVQQPDLLTCHWRCLSHQPILDITIPSTASFLVTPP
jgi:hypothetical protein